MELHGRRFPLPREHGSWVMLVLPASLPLLALRAWAPAAGWTLLAMVALFLGREPLRQRLRGAAATWTVAVPLAGAAVAGAAALLRSHSLALAGWALLAAAVLAAELAFSRVRRITPRRALFRELAGVAGLTAGAPALAAALGRPPAFQLGLWLLALMPFGLGTLHVDRFVTWRREHTPEAERRRSAFLLLAAAAGGAVLLSLVLTALEPITGVPGRAALAWAPELLHLASTARRPEARADFKRIGLEETASGILWLILGSVLIASA
ncbi:MAG: YwiC-like family protein [Bacillota bacterium]|nr:YwiC-like family protein [Bacillota bacterium]